MTLSASKYVGAKGSRSAGVGMVAFVDVRTTVVGVSGESFGTHARVVADGVLANSVLSARVRVDAFINVCNDYRMNLCHKIVTVNDYTENKLVSRARKHSPWINHNLINSNYGGVK